MNSAVSAALAIRDHDPKAVISIGSAGGLGADVRVGDIIVGANRFPETGSTADPLSDCGRNAGLAVCLDAGRAYVGERTTVQPPTTLTDGREPGFRDWTEGYDPDTWLDREVNATRRAVFPLHGLDPLP